MKAAASRSIGQRGSGADNSSMKDRQAPFAEPAWKNGNQQNQQRPDSFHATQIKSSSRDRADSKARRMFA